MDEILTQRRKGAETEFMKVKIILCLFLSLALAQAKSNLPIAVSNLAATNFNSQKLNQNTNNPAQATQSTKCNQDSHGISDEILSGTVSGIATALLWAIFVWGWQIIQTFRIRRAIQKALASEHGVAGSLEFFGICLRNNSPWPIIIRSTGFLCSGDINFELEYKGTKSPVYEDRNEKHILLKTETSDIWQLPIEMLAREIVGVWVKYEYETVFGKSKVGEIKLSGEAVQFFEHMRKNDRSRKGLPLTA